MKICPLQKTVFQSYIFSRIDPTFFGTSLEIALEVELIGTKILLCKMRF